MPKKYTVQRGDTLAALANRAGTTAQQLAQRNNINDPNRIDVGQTIRLPGASNGDPEPAKKGGLGAMISEGIGDALALFSSESDSTGKSGDRTASEWVTRPGDPYEYRKTPDGRYAARDGDGRVVSQFDNAPKWLKKKTDAPKGRPPASARDTQKSSSSPFTSKASAWVSRNGDPYEYQRKSDGTVVSRRNGQIGAVNESQLPTPLKNKLELNPAESNEEGILDTAMDGINYVLANADAGLDVMGHNARYVYGDTSTLDENNLDEYDHQYIADVARHQLARGNNQVDLAGENFHPTDPEKYREAAISTGMSFGNVTFERRDV